jgi:hypothetical protein
MRTDIQFDKWTDQHDSRWLRARFRLADLADYLPIIVTLRRLRGLQQRVDGYEHEVQRLRGVLQEIVDPLVVLKTQAMADGCALGDGATSIASDPNYLKGLARHAIYD